MSNQRVGGRSGTLKTSLIEVLDESKNTIDNDLEIRNFYAASEVLSNVWSKTVINGFKASTYSTLTKITQKSQTGTSTKVPTRPF